MLQSRPLRGRPHDAKGAQAAILSAAEAAFAERGFAGARIDAIAEAAGYNKSLIFHYFGDKLGLYMAVIERVREQANPMRAELWEALSDPTITADASRFRALLETVIKATFDFFVAHPRLLHILAWEEAEGWTTLSKISSELEDATGLRLQFTDILERAQRAGAIRPDISPHLFFNFVWNICRTYVTSVPLLQLIALGEDLSTPDALARAREQIAAFVVHGFTADPLKKP